MSRGSVVIRGAALKITVILATLFTAGVHLYLAASSRPIRPPLRSLFLLAALGYLGALTALYAPIAALDAVRWLARLVLLGVTVSSIAAYFVLVGSHFDALSLADKLAEAVLAVSLVLDGVAARDAEGGPRTPVGLSG
ncbi:MAG: hypothetical protein HY240_03840 [Actinobacteria bacterium]|nr:hypothetical protein [Actinomycetota bacterium]